MLEAACHVPPDATQPTPLKPAGGTVQGTVNVGRCRTREGHVAQGTSNSDVTRAFLYLFRDRYGPAAASSQNFRRVTRCPFRVNIEKVIGKYLLQLSWALKGLSNFSRGGL
jgi:hypothetical protein